MNKHLKQKIISGLSTIFILVLILSLDSGLRRNDANSDLFVYYLDVGQGDSALIEAPNGIQILIDAGKGDKVLEELDKVIPFWDTKIDILVLSHGDLDHIGGFFDVLDKYDIDKIVRSTAKVNSEYEKELLDKAQSLDIQIVEIKTGDDLILDQTAGIFIKTYSPEENPENFADRNENSLVLELIYGESEFLFTGDATIETEAKLLQNFPDEINSDILKVGHHGSKTSTSQAFLDEVSPDYSILSFGENSYGHPTQEVLDKLQNSGTKIFETKNHGTIVARSDGNSLEVSFLSSLLDQASFFQSLINTIFVNSFNTPS